MTFDFLALKAYRETIHTSLNRVLMISAGAIIALVVSWLPPRQLAQGHVEGARACSIRRTQPPHTRTKSHSPSPP